MELEGSKLAARGIELLASTWLQEPAGESRYLDLVVLCFPLVGIQRRSCRLRSGMCAASVRHAQLAMHRALKCPALLPANDLCCRKSKRAQSVHLSWSLVSWSLFLVSWSLFLRCLLSQSLASSCVRMQSQCSMQLQRVDRDV